MTDDELEGSLRDALELAGTEPDPAQIGAVRALAAGPSPRGPVVAFPEPRSPRARRMLVAVAAAALLVVAGGAAAVAAGVPLPTPVRGAASTLGLVDSPELHDAKVALHGLQSALSGNDDERIAADRSTLLNRLAALSSGDRAQISRDAEAALAEADKRLREGNGAPGAAPSEGDGPGRPEAHGASGTEDHGEGSHADHSQPAASSPGGGEGGGGGTQAATPTTTTTTTPSSDDGGSHSGGMSSSGSGSGGGPGPN